MVRRTFNENLEPLPSHAQIARGIIGFGGDAVRYGRRWYGEVSANALADALGVQGARRLGSGAVKGSWTGTMSGSLRLAPSLRAMERRGLVRKVWDNSAGRYHYSLTVKGRALAEEGE